MTGRTARSSKRWPRTLRERPRIDMAKGRACDRGAISRGPPVFSNCRIWDMALLPSRYLRSGTRRMEMRRREALAQQGDREQPNGYEIELELPLFDFGAVRAARPSRPICRPLHRIAKVAVDARSEVRETYSAYRTSFDLAKHYRDEVVPLRKRISEENVLRYNGMLIGVFEPLADSREQVMSVTGYVEASVTSGLPRQTCRCRLREALLEQRRRRRCQTMASMPPGA